MNGTKNSETTGRDNCGHDPGLTTEAPAGKPLQAEGVEGNPGPLRDSTQKAMHENLMECHRILPPPCKGRLRSTAVCGKPHVRWCGRVPGRNPRHPTRSEEEEQEVTSLS